MAFIDHERLRRALQQDPLPPHRPLAVRLASILTFPSGAKDTPPSRREENDLPMIGPGWVYTLTNRAFPHLVKIGHSTDAPENRATELNSTGIPLPFVVEFKIYVGECGGLETAAHEQLSKYRINARREFFHISLDEAAECITRLAVQREPGCELIVFIRENGEVQRVASGLPAPNPPYVLSKY